MPNPQPDDDFTPEEKQERFLKTIRGALNTPPEPKSAAKKKKPVPADPAAARRDSTSKD